MEPRRSPPKHRHDGTSPLPLGMDWSPPPKKWNGRETVWPHDPRTGWSYCITIPAWVVLPKSKDSDPVVFYRVVVGLQSPQGITTSRAVLRRFNDFLRLLAALRKAFPKKNLPPAPPKGLLRLKSRTLLEERRCCLEEWMTKLLSDIDISRSIVVASFLELESAARSSFQDENPEITQSMASSSTQLTPDYSSDTAYEASEIGSSSLEKDNISEDLSLDEDLTNPVTKHAINNIDEGLLMGNAILEQVEGINKVMRNNEKNGDGKIEKLSNGTNSLRKSVSLDVVELTAGNLISSNDVNLVLPLGQQQKMNRVLISMHRRLGTAKTDMEDLISRLNQETAVKDYLMTKVKDLEEELETTKLRNKENLEHAILMERERVTQMQWDMEELTRKSLEMELKLKSQQETEQPRKVSVIEEKDELLRELDDTKNKFEKLLKKHQELEVKSKADVKVLVKEVKSLRNSQAELKQQLNQSGKLHAEKLLEEEKQKYEKDEIGRVKLLHECEILQHRVRECSMNLVNENEDKLVIDSPSLEDALQLVKISDGRIEALFAQAQILAHDETFDVSTPRDMHDDGDDDGDDDDDKNPPNNSKLRKMVLGILVDNISLTRQVMKVVHRGLEEGIITTKNLQMHVPLENLSLDTK